MTAKTAPAPVETWAVCSGCHKARRLEGEVLRPHRRYVEVVRALDEPPGLMLSYPGSGQPPASVAAAFISAEDG